MPPKEFHSEAKPHRNRRPSPERSTQLTENVLGEGVRGKGASQQDKRRALELLVAEHTRVTANFTCHPSQVPLWAKTPPRQVSRTKGQPRGFEEETKL